jgi:hypothetical protein
LTLVGYDTDQSTYITIKYIRPPNTGDSQGKDAVLTYGQQYPWAFTWKSGSLVIDKHHVE